MNLNKGDKVETLTADQDELLREMWQDKATHRMPYTVAELVDENDLAESITQEQLQTFVLACARSERCWDCATDQDVAEMGLCGECLTARES